MVKKQSGKIIWINDKATKLFNLNQEDFEEIYFNDVIPDGLALAEKASCKNVSVMGAAISNFGEFFIELSATMLDDCYLVTVRDVTAMTNVMVNAEKTGKLNKDKNFMLTKLSNEFKSPLQSILGFSSQVLNVG